jgi:hypothetical protein
MDAHCLAPSCRQSSANELTFSSYGRLFPDLPPFSAEDSFLFALGGVGGLCDCQLDVDDEASLGQEAPAGPFLVNSSHMTSPLIARPLGAGLTHASYAMRAHHS